MNTDLDKISQISIYLKNSDKLADKVSEVALFNPLSKSASFDEESNPLTQRKWTFHSHLPLSRRFFLNIQTFCFHHLKLFIPSHRKTPEAKFKTALAILLAQESLREYFLGTLEKRKHFFAAALHGAHVTGYSFSAPDMDLSLSQTAKALTSLPHLKKSLVEDLAELNLQMAALPTHERNEILFAILNNIERPPVNSVIEVASDHQEAQKIELLTKYAKVQVHHIDKKTGKIDFTQEQDHATSSIETHLNVWPGKKGVMNQRMVLGQSKDGAFSRIIGSYCGEILTSENVLEQLLFLLQEENALQVYLWMYNDHVEEKMVEDKTVLFTSLFSWNEYDKILREHFAIDDLHGKVLKIVERGGHERYLRLHLYHQNLSFNAWNKFPTPSETKANLKDLNDEMIIQLLKRAWNFLGLAEYHPLNAIAIEIEEARKESDFLKKQKRVIDSLDKFSALKNDVLALLAPLNNEVANSFKALLSKRYARHRKLSQMDVLIYTGVLTKHLGVFHNKNCEHSTDRTAGANAADKAQNAFTQLRGHSFLPLDASLSEMALFRVLYSMYLVWEEPELNAGLSTGFIGEKFFNNFIQKNPETTRYLTPWLKHHPEMYLGLSEHRQ